MAEKKTVPAVQGAVQAAPAPAAGVERVALPIPFKYEGEEVAFVDLSILNMSGADFRKLRRDYVQLMKNGQTFGQVSLSLALDDDFIEFAAMRVSGRREDFFSAMPVQDYMTVMGRLETFFLQSVSPTAATFKA